MLLATSVDAERAFSRGRLTVSRLRHSLSEQSVRASTVLGSWARIPGLVPEQEMIDMIADKKGKRARVSASEDGNGLVPDADEGEASEKVPDEQVYLHGFSTDEDSSDDEDIPEPAPVDVQKLPTVMKDDQSVKKRLDKAKKRPVSRRIPSLSSQ